MFVKLFLLGAVIMSAAMPVYAQEAAPAAAQAPAAAPAPLNGDSPIEAIAATPAGKAALEKHFPEILPHPAYEQFKAMSLRALAPLAGGIITDEKIAALEADLKAAK
jgi:hypothetical protein